MQNLSAIELDKIALDLVKEKAKVDLKWGEVLTCLVNSTWQSDFPEYNSWNDYIFTRYGISDTSARRKMHFFRCFQLTNNEVNKKKYKRVYSHILIFSIKISLSDSSTNGSSISIPNKQEYICTITGSRYSYNLAKSNRNCQR